MNTQLSTYLALTMLTCLRRSQDKVIILIIPSEKVSIEYSTFNIEAYTNLHDSFIIAQHTEDKGRHSEYDQYCMLQYSATKNTCVVDKISCVIDEPSTK